jgi:hypothetical protein
MMTEFTQSKKRGRPATGTNPSVGVRLSPATIENLDAWRAKQPGIPGRPEAIRRLIEAALGKAKPSSSAAKKPRSTGKSAGRAR